MKKKIMSKKYSIFDVVKDTIKGTVETSEENLSKERLDICNACPYLKSALRICGKCGCYVPSKVKYKSSQCPIGKW